MSLSSRTTELLELAHDKINGSLSTIDTAHHRIHQGKSFTVSHKADILNGATFDFLIVTPNTSTRAHMTVELDVEAETDMLIYEAVTATAGTALTAYNRDRNSSTAATVVITHTPSAITEGTTIIRTHHIGNGKSYGGADRTAHEFILKQNAKYLFRLTNATSSNNYMSVKFDWYEV